jgi:hypothetical protein
MRDNVVSAVEAFQKRVLKSAYDTRGAYDTERLERALDELVRHPEREAEPVVLQRNAFANARIAMRRRREIAAFTVESALSTPDGEPVSLDDWSGRAPNEDALVRIEFDDWLARSGLSERDRELLSLAMDDPDWTAVAADWGVALPRLQVQLSHARARARSRWAA